MKPTGTCGKRDFMRVEMEDYQSDGIEKEMSNFEMQCIDAIRRSTVRYLHIEVDEAFELSEHRDLGH
jgi:hypothetical protein